MQRIKTAAELEQERRDEEFARQLAAELEQEPPTQQQQYPANQTVRVACPVCLAINNVSASSRGQAHACGACGAVIPESAFATSAGWGGPMSLSDRDPSLYQPRPIHGAPSGQQRPVATSGVTCQRCRCINQIPSNSGATQFMCGGCAQLLTFNQPIAAPPPHPTQVPPPSVEIGGPSSGTRPIGSDSTVVAQGQPLQGRPASQQVQVRCFSCQTINLVLQQPGQTIQFICGSCRSVNRV